MNLKSNSRSRILKEISSPHRAWSLLVLCPLILFTGNYLTTFEVRKLFNIDSEFELESKRIDSSRENFVWSEELGDWTIDRQFSGEGSRRRGSSCIWPEDCDSLDDDRVVDQLKLYKQAKKLFKILPPDYSFAAGRGIFFEQDCPVNRCELTYDSSQADALIFQNSDVRIEVPQSRRKDQIWIAYFLESPVHTFDRRYARKDRGRHEFNLTASYRADSDIVTPYSKFVPYSDQIREYQELARYARTKELRFDRPLDGLDDLRRGLISKKGGKVAWFASNCNTPNRRLDFVRELSNYIQVDVYGRCGNLTCAKWNQTGCSSLVNEHYKFYLSFENSNCRHYITEKLYRNANGYNNLDYLVVPIVMGPSREDYEKFAPPASFIHVDDFKSPKDLANYLNSLSSDDTAYLSYFRWKFVGKFIDTKFMCRVCALLHSISASQRRKSYTDVISWWNTYNRSSACEQI